LINQAYEHQNYIGWGHFLRGRLSLQWKHCIAHYYKTRQPGDAYTPTLWARKTIDQVFDLFLALWTCRNGEKHGKDYDEQREIALRMTREEVQQIYEFSRNQDVNDLESSLLHARPLEQILTWTKSHLDAYLATAEVILEQNVDPG